MNTLPFVKMHGAGNDYVFLDGFESELPQDLGALAQMISLRHTGVGSDGLVALRRPASSESDVHMQMWNADGSEGLMCGNALRCIALLMHRRHGTRDLCRIQTATRIVNVTLHQVTDDGASGEFSADLGSPSLARTLDCSRQQFPELSERQDLPEHISVHRLDIGNPHAVIFEDRLHDRLIHDFGAAIAEWSAFADGANVEWVHRVSKTHLRVRVWERGSGETRACGSGACAVVAVAVQLGYCDADREINVELPGGTLKVRRQTDGRLILRGPAEVSFEGVWRGTD